VRHHVGEKNSKRKANTEDTPTGIIERSFTDSMQFHMIKKPIEKGKGGRFGNNRKNVAENKKTRTKI